MQLSNNIHTLEIDSVELSFNDLEVLSGVYLKIVTGEITGLLGLNGCGKTCLMRILFDDLKAKNRCIMLDSVWQKRLSHKQVLYLPQHSSMPKGVSVKRVFKDFNVDFSGFCESFPESSHLKDANIGDLSGGEQRIVEIYVILKAKSKFVMLDEPFSQIMPIHIEIIKALIIEAKSSKGILVSDHTFRNIIDISDSLYVMANRTVYLTKSNEDLVRYGYLLPHHTL